MILPTMRAVHWHRWLQTLCRRTAIDYVGPGIVRVYAYNEIEKATIMFAHPDNTSTLVEHTHSHGKSKKTQRRHVEIPNTQAHLEGWTVVMTDTSWLRIKADSWRWETALNVFRCLDSIISCMLNTQMQAPHDICSSVLQSCTAIAMHWE